MSRDESLVPDGPSSVAASAEEKRPWLGIFALAHSEARRWIGVDAEEFAQQTVVAYWLRRARIGRAGGWVRVTARCLARREALRLRAQRPLEDAIAGVSTGEDRLAAASDTARALCRLSRRDRWLVLGALAGFTFRDLARLLGCAPSVASTLLARAKARLRRILTEQPPAPPKAPPPPPPRCPSRSKPPRATSRSCAVRPPKPSVRPLGGEA